MMQVPLLIGIGLAGGFLAGLLGLGGSVVLAPLLLVVPAALDYRTLSMRSVAAITLVYLSFAAGASAYLKPQGEVDRATLLRLGPVAALAALAGGLLSARWSERSLLLLFALAATLATLLLLVPNRLRPGQSYRIAQGRLGRGRWESLLAGVAAAGSGLLTGGVGSAGGFLLEPLLHHQLGVAERAAPATALRIVLVSALAGLTGKALTGQVDPRLAGGLVAGALPAAWWGGELAARLNPRTLRWVAIAAAALATAALWIEAVPDLARRLRPGHLYLVALLTAALIPTWILARVYRGLSLAGPYLRPMQSTDPSAALVEQIWPEELNRLVLEGPQPPVIDLREPEEVADGWVPGAVNIPFSQYAKWLEHARPADGTVMVCGNGRQSAQACEAAARLGCRVRSLAGGMADWKGPVERP